MKLIEFVFTIALMIFTCNMAFISYFNIPMDSKKLALIWAIITIKFLLDSFFLYVEKHKEMSQNESNGSVQRKRY